MFGQCCQFELLLATLLRASREHRHFLHVLQHANHRRDDVQLFTGFPEEGGEGTFFLALLSILRKAISPLLMEQGILLLELYIVLTAV